jgi:hypothetical protein
VPLAAARPAKEARERSFCRGPCTILPGNGVCNTLGTNCLTATTDVSFCDRSICGESYNQFNNCGTASVLFVHLSEHRKSASFWYVLLFWV